MTKARPRRNERAKGVRDRAYDRVWARKRASRGTVFLEPHAVFLSCPTLIAARTSLAPPSHFFFPHSLYLSFAAHPSRRDGAPAALALRHPCMLRKRPRACRGPAPLFFFPSLPPSSRLSSYSFRESAHRATICPFSCPTRWMACGSFVAHHSTMSASTKRKRGTRREKKKKKDENGTA